MGDMSWMRRFPRFRDLTDDELSKIGDKCVEELFVKDEDIVTEGDARNPGMFFVKSGSAKVVVKARGGARSVEFLRAGDTFGEMTMIEPEMARSASVVTLDRTRVSFLPARDYERLKRESPVTAFRLLEVIIRSLSARLRDRTKMIP